MRHRSFRQIAHTYRVHWCRRCQLAFRDYGALADHHCVPAFTPDQPMHRDYILIVRPSRSHNPNRQPKQGDSAK